MPQMRGDRVETTLKRSLETLPEQGFSTASPGSPPRGTAGRGGAVAGVRAFCTRYSFLLATGRRGARDEFENRFFGLKWDIKINLHRFFAF
jgi:hypothetical protein